MNLVKIFSVTRDNRQITNECQSLLLSILQLQKFVLAIGKLYFEESVRFSELIEKICSFGTCVE